MKVSISLPDELINYIDTQVGDRSQLVENLLQIWRNQPRNLQGEAIESCKIKMNLRSPTIRA
jgi:metal-responsive CopG/Arc/MetJ family transcriptional regulator